MSNVGHLGLEEHAYDAEPPMYFDTGYFVELRDVDKLPLVSCMFYALELKWLRGSSFRVAVNKCPS